MMLAGLLLLVSLCDLVTSEAAHYPAPAHHMPGPAAYGSQFPSHFYPEKLYQYWHHYYPRIPGISPALCVINCVSNIFA